MLPEHEIALRTTKELVYSGKPFTFDELQNKILDKNGFLRIAPGFTLGEYIQELEEDGIINLNFDKENNPYYQLNKRA